MKRVLYIHGYNGHPNGSSFQKIKAALPDDYKLIGIDYNDQNPEEAFATIKDAIIINEPALIIGSSLGGYLVSLFGSNPRIVINPCMNPSIELPKIGCSKDIAERYNKLDSGIVDLEDKITIIGCFGDEDELLGNKYIQVFKDKYGINNNIKMIHSGHHISDNGAKEVASYIPELFENCKWLIRFMNDNPA